MTGFESLLAEEREVNIEGVVFKITSFSVRDYATMLKMKEEPEYLKDLVYNNLKVNHPDLTREVFDKLRVDVFNKLVAELMDLSGLNEAKN